MSPKPWAKLEVGYLNHPKFLALNANAICLWHEGKQYCDMHHTDGLIPKEALKTFRFRGSKSIALLMASCGQKPDGTAYAALWEDSVVGFKMHDYLDHNDCREAVLARMELADERRDADRERKAEWRAKKKDKRDMSHGTRDGTETSPSRSITEAVPVPESETPLQVSTEQKPEGTHRARPAPLVGRRRRDAAFEWGRLYVPERAHQDLLALRNNPNGEAELWPFYERVCEAWTHGPHAADNPGSDLIRFWKARYDEEWPPTSVASKSRIDAWQPRTASRS